MSKLLPLVCVCIVAAMARPAVAQTDDLEAAKAHDRAARKAYELEHYAEAAREYEAAYQAKDMPELLYNIAQAYRLAGDPQKAIHFYTLFLRRVPGAPTRADIEARISELQKTIDEQARTKATKPDNKTPAIQPAPIVPPTTQPELKVTNNNPPPAPERKPIYKQWWLWTSVGVVVVAVGVGLGVGLSQSSTTYPTGNTPAGIIRW